MAAIKGFRFHLPLQPIKFSSEGHLCGEHMMTCTCSVLQCYSLLTLLPRAHSWERAPQQSHPSAVVCLTHSPECSHPLCPQLVPMTFLKNAYLSHSIHCHMQTVQKVTYNLGHRPAHELAQQCFLPSVVYSHNLNSNMKT